MTPYEASQLLLLAIDSLAILVVSAAVLLWMRKQDKRDQERHPDSKTVAQRFAEVEKMLEAIKPGDPVVSQDGKIKGVVRLVEPDALVLDRNSVRIDGKRVRFKTGECPRYTRDGFIRDVNSMLWSQTPDTYRPPAFFITLNSLKGPNVLRQRKRKRKRRP